METSPFNFEFCKVGEIVPTTELIAADEAEKIKNIVAELMDMDDPGPKYDANTDFDDDYKFYKTCVRNIKNPSLYEISMEYIKYFHDRYVQPDLTLIRKTIDLLLLRKSDRYIDSAKKSLPTLSVTDYLVELKVINEIMKRRNDICKQHGIVLLKP